MPESETDLTKLFQSSEELLEPEVSTLQGQIPEWLNCGKFIRIGPGLFDLPGNFTLNHWLDGYAMLSKFEIQGNRVAFDKKFLQSDAYRRAMAAQKPVITEFGTKAYPDPNKGLLSRLVSTIMPEMTDNTNSNIFKLGKDYFVCNDSCFFRHIDPNNLKTGNKFDSQRLYGLNGMSAHPLKDEESGDMYNIGFSALTGLKFSVIRIPGSDCGKTSKEMLKEAKVVCNIPSSYGPGCVSYVHSFGMTSKYILFIEQPYVLSIASIASALIKGLSVKEFLDFRPNLKNRFHIIDKETGKLIKTEIISDQPFFFLHIVNCYIEDDEMVVDVMALDDPSILDGMFLCKLRNNIIEDNAQPSARRFVIPVGNAKLMPLNTNLIKMKGTQATAIKTGTNTIVVSADVITEPGCEMPVINKKFVGKKYSYIYANGTIAQNSFRNAICKINVNDRSCMFWRDSEYMFPGEPVFVPNPETQDMDEDDGILIAAMSNVKEDDVLVFIDAKSMTEVARATFKHIPGALHGIFVES